MLLHRRLEAAAVPRPLTAMRHVGVREKLSTATALPQQPRAAAASLRPCAGVAFGVIRERLLGFLNKPGRSRPARRFPPLPAPRPKMAAGTEGSSGASMAATRLELTLMRLLSRCEALAAERRDPEEWRLEKVRLPRSSRPSAPPHRVRPLRNRDRGRYGVKPQPLADRVFVLNAVA